MITLQRLLITFVTFAKNSECLKIVRSALAVIMKTRKVKIGLLVGGALVAALAALVYLPIPGLPSPHGKSMLLNTQAEAADRTAERAEDHFRRVLASRVPSGTGILILAADEVEVAQNDLRDNHSFGVAVLGLDIVFGSNATYDVDPSRNGAGFTTTYWPITALSPVESSPDSVSRGKTYCGI